MRSTTGLTTRLTRFSGLGTSAPADAAAAMTCRCTAGLFLRVAALKGTGAPEMLDPAGHRAPAMQRGEELAMSTITKKTCCEEQTWALRPTTALKIRRVATAQVSPSQLWMRHQGDAIWLIGQFKVLTCRQVVAADSLHPALLSRHPASDRQLNVVPSRRPVSDA